MCLPCSILSLLDIIYKDWVGGGVGPRDILVSYTLVRYRGGRRTVCTYKLYKASELRWALSP